MKKNIFGFTLSAMLFAVCLPVQAQQQKRIPRMGYLSGTGDPQAPGHQVEAFRQGLRDLGYIEGKNILVNYRYIEGMSDRTPSLVTELLKLRVDAIVVTNPPAVRAAKQATKTIPVVMVTTEDPVATGIVESLARPGGNITGLSRLTRELSGKRLELLNEIVPGISRVGVLWASTVGGRRSSQYYEDAARALKMPLQSLEAHGPNPDFEGTFQAAAKGRVSALIVVRTAQLSPYLKLIADLAINTDCLQCAKQVTS
jgi:putative tryptophan/tyrosine transport system substrate-binding protein